MSKRSCVTIWAKNPDTRQWDYIALWNNCCVTLGGDYVETPEGHRQHSHHYTRRGNIIHLETIEDGADCDGHHTRYWRGAWTIGGPLERDRSGFMVPKFTEINAFWRDHAAEKAGY
ncbi:MAG: hypothetical protein ACO395_10270 [Pontimonas sp.]